MGLSKPTRRSRVRSHSNHGSTYKSPPLTRHIAASSPAPVELPIRLRGSGTQQSVLDPPRYMHDCDYFSDAPFLGESLTSRVLLSYSTQPRLVENCLPSSITPPVSQSLALFASHPSGENPKRTNAQNPSLIHDAHAVQGMGGDIVGRSEMRRLRGIIPIFPHT